MLLLEAGAALAVGVVVGEVQLRVLGLFLLRLGLEQQHEEVVPLVFVLFQHHLNERVEGLVLSLVLHPLHPLLLDEVGMGLLAGFVDVVGPLLQAELAHRADEQQREAERIDVQLERIEHFLLGMPHVPQELGRGVFDGGQVNECLGVDVELNCVLEVTEQVLALVDQDVLRLDVAMRDALPLQLAQYC